MIKKILKGYSTILSTLFRLASLVFVCVTFSFLVVYPLWKLADVSPFLYTILFGILIASVILYWLAKKAMQAFRISPLNLFRFLAKNIILIFGLIFSVYLVFQYQKLFALFILLFSFIIYGILAFGLSENEHIERQ